MSYRVRVEAFEGPFDLLLNLVSRQKVDIGDISITEIADQYLEEVDRMKDLDLDVASDFLVVASTLLQIKAASLIPQNNSDVDVDEEFSELSAEETRDILVARLIAYKQFKNAAAALGTRMENESHMHPREAGLESQFLGLMPDYLSGVTLHGLAVICADIAARRHVFLLEAEHIAAAPIPMEKHVEGIYRTMKNRQETTFSDLMGTDPTPELLVGTFLAVLELYKRGVLAVEQSEQFADFDLRFEEDAPELTDFSMLGWDMDDEETQELDEIAEPDESQEAEKKRPSRRSQKDIPSPKDPPAKAKSGSKKKAE